MPFVSIRLAGSATRDQKAGIVAARQGRLSPGQSRGPRRASSLVTRLGKNPAAVQVVIEEVSTENYGAGGQLIADRDSPALSSIAKGDAHAEPRP